MLYVNYNKYGQAIGHNSRVPTVKLVDGVRVTFDGDISKKSFDLMQNQGLISHTMTGQPNILFCVSEAAALRVADIIRENPNYKRGGE